MPDAIYQLAADTLEAVQDAGVTYGVTLPSRQYVHAGDVAFDCEEVVVTMARIFHGPPNAEQFTGERAAQKSLELHAWIVRCIPGMTDNDVSDVEPPTAAALDAAAQASAGDMRVLVYGLRAAYASKDLFSTCQAVAWGQCQVVGPAGKFVGLDFMVRVQL